MRGGDSKTTPIDPSNGVLKEATGATACTYVEGGTTKQCFNTTKNYCDSSHIYGSNQQFYAHSRCSDLGY